ncbi:hypothetical protein PG997_012015 [Apiospora hydei]|uniref:Uncharacterized protein n=1 Tax=Apiospora hydei TaxID=1337664 RepID=A0ABR1V5J4_9PEZI
MPTQALPPYIQADCFLLLYLFPAAATSSSQPTTARKSKKKSKSHCLRAYLQQPESRLITKSNAGTTAVAAAASHAISQASSEAKMSRDIKKIMGPFERG